MGFGVVDIQDLSKSSCYKLCLVLDERAILKFVVENPAGRSKVTYKLSCMSCIVMVGSHYVWAIEL